MVLPFTPPAQTTPDVMAANQVKQMGNRLYNTMVQSYTQAYRLVWNNPNATPVQVVTAMGTEAQKIFTLSGALGAYLHNAGATDIPLKMPEGFNYVENPDGSVTLTVATPTS